MVLVSLPSSFQDVLDQGRICVPVREAQTHDLPMQTRPGLGQGELPKGGSPSPRMLRQTLSGLPQASLRCPGPTPPPLSTPRGRPSLDLVFRN